jgi:thymidylate kinase
MHRKGAVFAFEGPDGVGKTTLISAVEGMLSGLAQPVLTVSFPGRTPGTLGAHVYDLHHRSLEHNVHTLTPDGLQILHLAAHVDAIQSVVRPHVEKGGIVLLDRYWWSTWVYGLLSGIQFDSLKKMVELERSYWLDLAPQVVFLVRRPSTAIDVDHRAMFVERAREYNILADRELESSGVVRVENSGHISAAAVAAVRVIARFLDVPIPNSSSSSVDLPSKVHSKTVLSATEFPSLPFNASPEGKTEASCSNDKRRLTIWSRVAPAKPTVVFNTYWRFAAERQAIFFRRFHELSPPWTDDPILSRYKFTNAYRASDRVSQYLIRNVIYRGDQSPREIFFRVILFKFFNRIDTWNRLLAAFGELTAKRFKPQQYDNVLTAALESGELLYSGAYIMPSGGLGWREDRKHRMHLRLLEYMLSHELPERVAGARSMRGAFELLKGVPTIGDFLAYQYVTDLNYSTTTDFGENEFVVAGPGARDGIRKCFECLGGLTEADLIRFVCDRQEEEFGLRSLKFEYLWQRPLQLIDCQNLFCEVDKYSRVYHPDVKVKSGRARIKQQFRPSPTRIDYWYPPKWGLNDRILHMIASETAVRSSESARHSVARY